MSNDNLTVVAAKEAIGEMNPSLKKVFDTMVDKAVTESSRTIMTRYEVGELVTKVTESENKYGEGAVKKLAAGLQIPGGESELYKHQNVVAAWSKSELAAMLKLRLKGTKRGITWSHLTQLASVGKPKARKKFTDRVFKSCLTVRELAAAIQQTLGSRTNNPNGARVTPKSPSAGVAVLHKLSSSYLEQQESFDESIFGSDVIDEKVVSSKLVDVLDAAVEEHGKLADATKANLNKLRATADRARRVLASKETNSKKDKKKKKTGASRKSTADARPTGKKIKKKKSASKTSARPTTKVVKPAKKKKKKLLLKKPAKKVSDVVAAVRGNGKKKKKKKTVAA
jgi:hypothetical protein